MIAKSKNAAIKYVIYCSDSTRLQIQASIPYRFLCGINTKHNAYSADKIDMLKRLCSRMHSIYFFYVLIPFRTWAIISLYSTLSFVAFSYVYLFVISSYSCCVVSNGSRTVTYRTFAFWTIAFLEIYLPRHLPS